ncbi:FAD-dependent monooxygenase [Sinorhizobium sp. BG8]|uniref:FAD-dependent monooxygenase n=1 Tax=Sinorhizobium sp. BG8 TaxID=2613773 RepID=UPI00193E5E47|nr:FAD-dependent monooxygenase [Sinorhizobium sp. BG8]QRM55559.1 FAD-dependent oxidoreductase [Sinorhizobium sp. BG8]
MATRSVAIIGAGIAGLTAALCLARRGIHTDIFEQSELLQEVGAGLQLSPNATSILDRLGILRTLESCWTEPESIMLASGATLRPLASVPVGGVARSRWGAPYGVLHRATLQKTLLEAVGRQPLCSLHLGSRIEPEAATASGSSRGSKPMLTVAADGVWSTHRKSVPGSAPARFTGNVAWRFLVPFDRAPSFLARRSVSAFVGPRAHLIAYPLNDAKAFNLVALHQGNALEQSWSRPVGAGGNVSLLRAFEGWHADILDVLGGASSPMIWPLFGCADGRWYDDDALLLIGDAAHATTPFAAQGAAMAIEDAWELGSALAGSSEPKSALRRFEQHRRERTARVRRRAAFNRFVYHARGPIAFGRDFALAMRKPAALAADFDWLYGYRSPD